MRPRNNAAVLLVSAAFAVVIAGAGCGGPKYPNCDNDDHCTADGHSGVCVNGTCVQCRDDAGCGRGKECKAGACTPIESFCDDKMPCPGNAPCSHNRCQPLASRPAPRECSDEQPCPNGQRCENGHCVSPPNGGPGCNEFAAPKFDFEGAELAGEARETLKRLADCISNGKLKNGNVLLTGHCDPRGEDEFNMGLGAQRAEAVKGFLVGLGVPAGRISTSSRGEIDARGVDEAGFAQDRRVDIEIR